MGYLTVTLARARRAVNGLTWSTKAISVERKLVWIMGSPRSGSTWLMHLLEEPPRVVALQEPLIGMHLGLFASYLVESGEATLPAGKRVRDLRNDERYFFSDHFRSEWGPPLRQLILKRLAPYVSPQTKRLVIQEPNGSEGADLVMDVLPSSYLLFLVRDGRDVIDSLLDAFKRGAWLDQAFGVGQDLGEESRARLVEREAQRWVARSEIVLRSYSRHPPDRRLLIRYEDLLADTFQNVRSIYEWFDVDAPTDLETRVRAQAFSALPEDAKGSGRFARAATPGLWRNNLSDDEKSTCNGVMSPMLKKLGYPVDG